MQQITHPKPDSGSSATSAIGWTAAMTLVRTAAAAMAGWSLYTVARHYGMPQGLALAAGLVFDGVAYMTLRLASDAVRAGRSAAGPIAATLGMAAISIYLNLVHARFTGGGRPAEVLYASPAVGLLVVSALSWSAERATARAERGETPMRMPTYGALGWALAGGKAIEELKAKAEQHVTSGASLPQQPASLPPARSIEDVIAAEFAEIDPAAAVERVAAAHPTASDTELAAYLASYRVSITPEQVAMLLGRAGIPEVTLDRVPTSPVRQPALGAQMRPDAPQVEGLTKADAITVMAKHLGGLDTPAETIATALAQQGRATDTAYIRTALSRARRAEAEAKAAREQAASDAQTTNTGTGFYP